MKTIDFKELQATVLKENYCSGCGVCTALSDGAIQMEINSRGQYFPKKIQTQQNPQVVCPFADHQTDENFLAEQLFYDRNTKFHLQFGFYQEIFAGYVADENIRLKGSSGGGVSWLTNKLLDEKLTDYVVHVKPSTGKVFFSYEISKNAAELKEGSKSRYYPVSMNKTLQFIKENPGNYTIVGLPCFIKGIRLLQKSDEIFRERIKYTVSLFCGHLKTTHYTSMLISQFQVNEKEVESIDYRHKIPGKPANEYATALKLKSGEILVKPNKELFGTDWGWGLFKLKVCDYCDDIIGETADISFGDAWIPEFVRDWKGTNIIVTRNPELHHLIENGIQSGELQMKPLPPEKLIESQAGGFRHRREGLAYRLYLDQKNGKWTPPKRMIPEKIKSKKRRKIYELRILLRDISLYSENYKQPELLKKEIMPIVHKLNKVYEHSAWTKLRLKIKNLFK